jgi:7-cyano-7-deazaguanine tRNA-ribosyltransferase
VLRFGRQLDRFTIEGSVLISAYPTKKDNDYDNVLIFKPPFGSYPQELAEVYPFNAEVVRTPDYESLQSAYLNTIRLVELNPDAEFTFLMHERFDHPLVEKLRNMDNFTLI